MLIYKGKEFKDRIEFMYYLLHKDELLLLKYEKVFFHSNIYYVRESIKQKLNISLTLKEVQDLLAEELALGNIKLFEEKGLNGSYVSC